MIWHVSAVLVAVTCCFLRRYRRTRARGARGCRRICRRISIPPPTRRSTSSSRVGGVSRSAGEASRPADQEVPVVGRGVERVEAVARGAGAGPRKSKRCRATRWSARTWPSPRTVTGAHAAWAGAIAVARCGGWPRHRRGDYRQRHRRRPSGAANRVIVNVDFTDPRGRGHDFYGHGTHIAGIVAARDFNSRSTGADSGMAPAAHLINLKVLDTDGSGEAADVIDAIDWAIRYRKRVRHSRASTCRWARRRRRVIRTTRFAWPSSAPSRRASWSSPRPAITARRRRASWSSAASRRRASRPTRSRSAHSARRAPRIRVTTKWRRGVRRVRRWSITSSSPTWLRPARRSCRRR